MFIATFVNHNLAIFILTVNPAESFWRGLRLMLDLVVYNWILVGGSSRRTLLEDGSRIFTDRTDFSVLWLI